jgi:hypothetical protein
VTSRGFWALLLVASGCAPTTECEATIQEDHRTSVRVEWTSRKPADSWVEFGVDGEYDRSTPVLEGVTDHGFTLLGLPPLADVTYRAVTEIGGEARYCEGEIATENVPADLPEIEVTIWEPDLASTEPWLMGGFLGNTAGMMVYDREGRPVWYQEAAANRIWLDVQPVPGSTRIAHNVFDLNQEEDVGVIREFDMTTGESTGSWRTVGGHHMFAQIPDGFAYTAIDERYWADPDLSALVPVVGDAVVEIPREGDAVTVSSTWDWLPVEKNSRWDNHFYPTAFDWTHANALKYMPDSETYLLSLGNPGLVVEIDRATGLPLRTFGEAGDWPLAEDAIPWDHPHDPSLTADGTLLVFVTEAATGYAGAVEYRLDEPSHTLVEIWRAGFDIRAVALGQARRLENGNTLVSFGANGLMREITPAGEVAWEATAPSGQWYGQVQLVNDLYEGQ